MSLTRMLLSSAIACFVFLSAVACSQDESNLTKEPELVGEGMISRDDTNESAAIIDPDGKIIYFQRPDANNKYAIHYAKSDQAGWSEPSLIEFGQLEHSEGDPFISPDGATMLYASTRPIADNTLPNFFHIWEVEKKDNIWGDPRPLGPSINIAQNHQYWPSISSNGNLYFVINPGLGEDDDIYFSMYEDGEYMEPVPLFDSPDDETSPYIAPDESYLLFTRFSHQDPMTADIFITYNRNGDWSVPEKLPPSINSDSFEGAPRITSDGQYLLFSRIDKETKNEDIYRIELRALDLKL
jgi:hypothetical protein